MANSKQVKSRRVVIDHVAMYVVDLEAAKDFFVRFFSAKQNAPYYNPKTGLRSYFLSFGSSFRLELINHPQVVASPSNPYQNGLTHVAFGVGGKDEVDTLTQQLVDSGYRLLSGPRTTGDGYYESVIEGPEGCTIEVTE